MLLSHGCRDRAAKASGTLSKRPCGKAEAAHNTYSKKEASGRAGPRKPTGSAIPAMPSKKAAPRGSPPEALAEAGSQQRRIEPREATCAAKLMDFLQIKCSCGKPKSDCSGNCLGYNRCRECGDSTHYLPFCPWAKGRGCSGWLGKDEGKSLSDFLLARGHCVMCFAPRNHSRVLHHKSPHHRVCSLDKRFARVIVQARLSDRNRPSHGDFLRKIFKDETSFNKFCARQWSIIAAQEKSRCTFDRMTTR